MRNRWCYLFSLIALMSCQQGFAESPQTPQATADNKAIEKSSPKENRFDPTEFTSRFYKEIDLNGDGINEKIEVHRADINGKTFLCVNGTTVSEIRWRPDDFYEIIDIDKNDVYKEIKTYVYLGQPNHQGDAVKIFYFDGSNTIETGTIEGKDSWETPSIGVDGSGIVTRAIRGGLLQPQLYVSRYCLSPHHALAEILPQNNLYQINLDATLKAPLVLCKSTMDMATATVLPPGSRIRIIATDNNEWCQVESSAGVKGWFAVDEFHIIRGSGKSSAEVFEGLYPKHQTLDLNGDGKEETIYFIDKAFFDTAIITVNGASITEGWDCNIVDIDTKDAYKEIAASNGGIGEDYSTDFYYYDGKAIVHMGRVEEGGKVDGSGEVKSGERSRYLQGCNLKVTYKIDAQRKLVKVPEKYHVLEPETKVTVLKKLMLKKTPDDPVFHYMLKPGQKIIIVYGNEDGWFGVKDESNRIGWFKVHDWDTIDGVEEPAREYFDGLLYAE